MDSFEEILQKKHLKRTKARVMILKVLQKSLPMTAGDVYEAVRKRDTKLSLSTVYRNCEALAKKGLLLRSTMLADGLTRYEYTQGDHVHHAVCLLCNKIFPVDVRLAKENGFEVTEHRVEIYGFCKECKARGMDKEFKERMI